MVCTTYSYNLYLLFLVFMNINNKLIKMYCMSSKLKTVIFSLQSSLLVDSVASLSSSPSSATSTASSDVHNEDCENTEPPLTKK